MKNIALLVCLLSAVFAGCASQPRAHERAHVATVKLAMDDGTCSGTVIGPHAILSATHCFTDTKTLKVDGQQVAVEATMSDGFDHTILLVSRKYAHVAKLGPAPGQADTVFIYGNPGALVDVFREGHVSATKVYKNVALTLYDLNGYYGDSGSGIFDARGRLVGVISLVFVMHHNGVSAKFMASLPLHFTEVQWQRATES